MATLLGFSRLFNYAASTCLRRAAPVAVCREQHPAPRLREASVAQLRTVNQGWLNTVPDYQTEVREWDEEREKICTDVISEINNQIAMNRVGRVFAVVQICGKQFKVTENDIIIIEGFWPPNIGDRLKLEKVLLVGGEAFTLVGRPILNRELISVDATVIEKTLSHTKTRFRFIPRKQYRRINFYRIQFTMLRINSIRISGNIDEKKEFEGLDRVY